MPIKSLHIDTARTWRGGQNQVLQLVTGLRELGAPAVLVAHEAGELRRRANEGLRFHNFSPQSEVDVRAAWTLSRIISDVQPDVVHAHDPMGVALAAMALPMVTDHVTPRFVASRRVDFHLKGHAFSRWKYRQVDAFIAASQGIAKILSADGIQAARVVVVHDGVNVGWIDRQPPVDAHAAFWLPKGVPIVGNVAALVGHKGQRHFIAAAKRVIRDVPDVRFLIVGEGELREPLERQIKELGLERQVLLTGFRDDAVGLQKSFDTFVMSSVTEGLGSAMLDAMACSCAVVASRTGGIPEAIEDESTGLLVPPQDEPALAKAIVRVLRDEALRRTLGQAARQRVIDEFSVERMVARTLAVYEGLR